MDATTNDALRAGGESPAVPIDFNRVIGVLRRRLRLFLAVFLGVAIIVALFALLSAPRYTSTATLLIDQHETDALHLNTITPQDAVTPVFGADSAAVDTQAAILQSRALVGAVVDQLQLDKDPEFNKALQPPGALAFLNPILHPGSPQPGLDDPALLKQQEREKTIDAVLKDLVVKRYLLTYTIDVAVTAYEPDKANVIANALVQRYLTQEVESKFDESSRGTTFLNDRLTQLRNDLEKADAAVQQYKIANNLMSAQGATLTEQQISNLDNQVAQARAQDAEQDARLSTAERQLASGSSGDDVGEAMGSPVVVQLRAQRAQASAQLADLQGRYGDRHPEIIKAKRALADIDTQISVEIKRVISNLKAQSQIAHSRTGAIVASAGQTRGSLENNNRALVRLNQLVTDDDAARTLYEGFLSRYKEAVAKEGNQQADARVVSKAEFPTQPSWPNKKLVFALATILGLVAATASVLLAELLTRGVSNGPEAEQLFDLPCLAEVPTLASTLDGRAYRKRAPSPYAYVLDKPMSRFAEAFRNLRAALATSRPGAAPQVIAVTSALPSEGKTTTTLCLARTAALGGAKVIVVDCDLRQRSITKSIGAEPKAGLLEVLNGAVPASSVLITDSQSSAQYLPVSESTFTPRDVFGSAEMQGLIATLRQHYDLILLDTAPVLAVADTRVLCPSADAVLFLTRWRKTSRRAVITALRALTSGGAVIAGIAITQVNVREQARVGEGAAQYYRAYQKYYVS